LASGLAAPRQALAQQAAVTPASKAAEPVLVTVPDCYGTSRDEVIKLVALELAPRMQVFTHEELGAGELGAQLSGTVRCDAPVVVITVEDPKRAPALRVELDLQAAVPEARTRLLALALAELITSSRLERTPESSSDREPPPPDHEEPPGEAEPEPVLELWLAPGLSSTGSPATTLFGGEVGIARALGRVLLLAELQARVGRAETTSSSISVSAFSALVGAAPLLLRGDVQLSVGLGARIGLASFSARAQRGDLAGDELSGFWLGPAALSALELAVLGSGSLRLGLEAGYVARGVIGVDERGQELLALRGAWVSAGLGFALHLR
jgi:hypothetical protein